MTAIAHFPSRRPLRSTFTAVYNNTDFRQLPAYEVLQPLVQALARRRQSATYTPASIICEASGQSVGEGYLPKFNNYNRTRIYLTFGAPFKRQFGPLENARITDALQQVSNSLYYWECQGQQRLTVSLDNPLFFRPRAVDALWWLMGVIVDNYRNNSSPGTNLGSYGTRTLEQLHHSYFDSELRFTLAKVDVKWWVFNRQVWEQLPQLIAPEQVTPMLAAYYAAYLHQPVGRRLSSSVLAPETASMLVGSGSRLHNLIRKSAAKLHYSPVAKPFGQMTEANVEPAWPLLAKASTQVQFDALKRDVLAGRF